MFEHLSIIFAGFLTLCIFSFLYKDNPFYRFAEHLYVGVSAGYMMARGVSDVMVKKLINPLLFTPQGTEVDYSLIIPITLGLFMILKLVPKVDWLSRWAIALIVGGTIGLSMTTRFKSDVILPVKRTVEAIKSKEITYVSINKMQSNIDLQLESSDMNHVNQLNNYLVLEAMALRNLIKTDGGLENISSYSFGEIEKRWEKAKGSKLTLNIYLERLKFKLKLWKDIYANAQSGLLKKQLNLKQSIIPIFKNEIITLSYSELDMKAYKLGKALKKAKKLQLNLKSSEVIVKLKIGQLLNQIDHCILMKYPIKPSKEAISKSMKDLQSFHKVFKSLMTKFDGLEGSLSMYLSSTKFFKLSTENVLMNIKAKELFDAEDKSFQEIFVKSDLDKEFDSTGFDLFKNLIIALGVLSTLIYFFFSTEHKGVVGAGAKIGIYFLMITFGASFGYTIMARISLLIGRMDFLLNKVSGAFQALWF